ncbi:hypothetical protein B0H11DRAFT_2082592 [Mycena galericulata]|nr:hypothetical protein B0H11DRAFT_2082592 [Mycena galericulata]
MADQLTSQLHALRHNKVPNARERASILQSISEAEIALSSGEDDQAQYLRSYISLLSSRLAPIRRLPFDVLSAIFMDSSLHNSIPDPDSSLLAGRGSDPLTAVSFHWRATAISTPKLWSIFSVSLYGNDNAQRLLQLYLDRSKNCPLSLQIRAIGKGQVHSGLLRTILGSCACWSKLNLRVDDPGLMACFAAVRGRLHCLEQLSLRIRGLTKNNTDTEEKMDAFEFAPKLTRLALNIPCSAFPQLPVAQIQSLTISTPDSLPLVTKFPNLIFLSCTGPNEFWATPFFLARLPSMVIHPTLMESLTTPNLTHLHLINGGTTWSPFRFVSFVRRSQFFLRSLVFENLFIDANDLRKILSLVPTVQTLGFEALRPNTLTDPLMRAVALGADGPHGRQLLPALLNFSVVGSYLFSTAALLDMLESRSASQVSESPGPPLSSLRHAKLHLKHREIGTQELDRLRALERRGVRLSVKCLDAEKQFVTVI